jgi:hypothetical protein
MPPPNDQTARPIFIVSTGRSGSTILTWCLGQHPNIIPQEESNWLGPFAIHAAADHKFGSVRGERGQLSANFISRDELLQALGEAINRLLLGHRTRFEDLQLRQAAGWAPLPFPVSRSSTEPKSRWVDGTPEYSLYICALRKLFPNAIFVHVVRDVTEVVRSLLNFRPYGNRLVEKEQQAYEYWLRRASACAEAEHAYGPRVIYRLRYSELVAESEAAMRRLLNFLGEPYASECLEPLRQRINSSKVPPDFNERDVATDPLIVRRAKELSEQLQSACAPAAASPQALAKIESDFDQQVEHSATLESKLSEATRLLGASAANRDLAN